MSNLISEPIDLNNNPLLTKVVGYNEDKRKSFNQLFTKFFNSVKDKAVLNEIYSNMHDMIALQDCQIQKVRRRNMDMEDKVQYFVNEKLFKQN